MELSALLASQTSRSERYLGGGGEYKVLVIDVGSGTCKAGPAGSTAPTAEFPTVVGRPRPGSALAGSGRTAYQGDQACAMRDVLTLTYPVEHGIVTNWDDMELIWHHALHDELGVSPEDHPLLLTERPPGPKADREKVTQCMFETFNVPALYIASQSVLALYAAGRTSGLAIDSGDGVTHVAPVYEGYTLPHAIHRLDIAGSALTDRLTGTLSDSNAAQVDREVGRLIKEKLCYVAVDFDEEMRHAASTTYQLPDGRTLAVGDARFSVPEALFRPSLLGIESAGLGELAYNSVMKCDICIRKDITTSVVLCGGTAMLPGIGERMQRELTALADTRVKIVSGPGSRKHQAWLGGSMLATLPSFRQICASKEEYDESGPTIIHSKCC